MNRMIVLVFLLFTGTAASAQVQLEVSVTNIKKSEGSIRVGLFDNSRDFLKRPIHGKIARVAGDSVMVSFSGIQPGIYGISVIHDRNDNGELDTNVFGIPKEGFAFGNNAMGMFGPPSFEKASIKIGDARIIQVLQLKHF